MTNKCHVISSGVCVLGTLVFLVEVYINKPHFSDLPSNILMQKLDGEVLYTEEIFENNDASSVWCLGRSDESQICHFNNLYYFPELKGHLIFILNENSTLSGIHSQIQLKNINLSSVKNLTNFNMKVILIHSLESLRIVRKATKVVKKKVLIMQRFKPDNIMHVIHDDLLPIYFTLRELCNGDNFACFNSYHLTFLDNFSKGPFSKWYEIFSDHEPTLLAHTKTALCIKYSVAGLNKESVWFQYGYKNTHGPVKNTNFNGLRLKEFSSFIKYRLITESRSHSSILEDDLVVLLNRRINRKILNYKALENNLQQIYFQLKHRVIKIVSLDLSTNDSLVVVPAIQKANLLIGMHGSAMMLSIFLPDHSDIIELFPFGIQPNFVSPLKALCSLPHVSYRYNSWVNENETNSFTHPEAHPLIGGIRHLPLDEQVAIEKTKSVPPVECCHNPLYLFRMFQDTIVDDSFYDLFRKTVTDRMRKSKAYSGTSRNDFIFNRFLYPPPVFNLTCECISGSLKIIWDFPFPRIGIRFSVATSFGKLLETELLHISIIDENKCKSEKSADNSLNQDVPVVSVWVKTLQADQESFDSYSKCLKNYS